MKFTLTVLWTCIWVYLTTMIVTFAQVGKIPGEDKCGVCEERIEDNCEPLSAGTEIVGYPCQECDGKGEIRNKPDGISADGLTRCCDGIAYAIDIEKEESNCWVWDDSVCQYVCAEDVDPPAITLEDSLSELSYTVELECSWDTAPIPSFQASGVDACGAEVSIKQEPASDSDTKFGDGNMTAVSIIATDECERKSEISIEVLFSYSCVGVEVWEEKKLVYNEILAEIANINGVVQETRKKINILHEQLAGIHEISKELTEEAVVAIFPKYPDVKDYIFINFPDFPDIEPQAFTAVSGVLIDYVLNILFPAIQNECCKLETLCSGYEEAYKRAEELLGELQEIYQGLSCAKCLDLPEFVRNYANQLCDDLNSGKIEQFCQFSPFGFE